MGYLNHPMRVDVGCNQQRKETKIGKYKKQNKNKTIWKRGATSCTAGVCWNMKIEETSEGHNLVISRPILVIFGQKSHP